MNPFAKSSEPIVRNEAAPRRRAGRPAEILPLVLLLALAAGLGYNTWRTQSDADRALRPTPFAGLAFSDVTVEVTEIPEPGGRAASTIVVPSLPGGPGGPAGGQPGGSSSAGAAPAAPAGGGGGFGGPAPLTARLTRLQSVLRQDILARLRDGGIPSAPTMDETGYLVEHSDRLRVRIVVSSIQPPKGSPDRVFYTTRMEVERPVYLSPRTRTPHQAVVYVSPYQNEELVGGVSSKNLEPTLQRAVRGLVDRLVGNYQRSQPNAQKETAG